MTYAIVSGMQSGMILNSATGEFGWTPSETQDGQFTVVFRATDNHNVSGADQTMSITVNEVNDAPVLANPGDQIVTELELLSLSLSAVDGDVVRGVADVVTYSIVAGLQTGMSLGASTGAFQWIPSDLQAGPYTVTFRAADSHGATHDQAVTITVKESNQPPTELTLSNTSVDENASGAEVGALLVTDPNAGQTHTFVVSDDRFEVVGGKLRLKDGVSLDFEVTSSFELQVTATDSGSPSQNISRLFTIAVNDVNDPPTEIRISNVVVEENISAAEIGSLMAVDQDAVQTHTYVSVDTRFEVVGMTLKLKEGQYLTAGLSGIVPVEVTATDSGTPSQSITQTLVITVSTNTWAWQYEPRPQDTNGDGVIVPLDALRVINLLNNPTILDEQYRLPVSRAADSAAYYYDVNGDGYCTSNDVLRIINYLIANSGEGEGENQASTTRLGRITLLPFVLASSLQMPKELDLEPDSPNSEQIWPPPIVVPCTTAGSDAPEKVPSAIEVADEWDDLDSVLESIASDVCAALQHDG